MFFFVSGSSWPAVALSIVVSLFLSFGEIPGGSYGPMLLFCLGPVLLAAVADGRALQLWKAQWRRLFGGAATMEGEAPPLQRRANPAAATGPARDAVVSAIRRCPVEEWTPPAQLGAKSAGELKRLLLKRGVDCSRCVTKRDLLDLVSSDTSSSQSCCICLEDYADGDVCRVLACGHLFHLECVDRWLYSALDTRKKVACPLCARPLL
jgi:hypothetical protein